MNLASVHHVVHRVEHRTYTMKIILFLAIILISIIAVFCNKTNWPELVGRPGAEAEAIIHEDDASLLVQIIPENSMVTMDYRLDRVRVFVNKEGTVVRAPRVG
jgi:uncharacterized membrane protein